MGETCSLPGQPVQRSCDDEYVPGGNGKLQEWLIAVFDRLKGGAGGQPPKRRIPLAEYIQQEKAAVGHLDRRQQAAFAASCAERLFAAYEGYRRSSGMDAEALVRQALDLAWGAAAGGEVSAVDAADLVERCVALIPSVEDATTIPAHADDAIAAAAYAVQAAAGLDPRAAAWAAQRGLDTLDSFLLSTAIDPADADADEQVWRHPLLEAEIRRRQSDLARLAEPDWVQRLPEIRRDAATSSVLPLGGPGDERRGE